jgi:predicted RNase H-like nuclease (RuvC/YqgF family)
MANGQLDEISEAIGRLSGQVDSLDRYTHEREHGINNLMQKVEALGTRITRDIAAVEGRIEGRIKAMDDRLAALEKIRDQQAGAKNLAVAILQSPLVGWLFAAAVTFAAWWKGKW